MIELADIPRPGFWARQSEEVYVPGQPFRSLDADGDGRILTQHQTDLLICMELWGWVGWGRSRRVDAAIAEILGDEYIHHGLWGPNYLAAFPESLGFVHKLGKTRRQPSRQRGGIHTNQVVRDLARQAWGDRDLNYKGSVDTRSEGAVRFALLELT